MQDLLVGVDTGGTFTDMVLLQGGTFKVHKVLSTPADPSRAIMEGLRHLGILDDLGVLVHGSTVATNAVLEQKGVPTGLITTAGFRDVLEIGRQTRPSLYDLRKRKVSPLVQRALRVEVNERLNERGEVMTQLDEASLKAAIEKLLEARVEAVAVSLLFSFANPAHERIVTEMARSAGLYVSASSEVLPEFREYERTSTVVLNAYIGPLIDRYLAQLEMDLPEQTTLRIMQSNGGSISSRTARREAARTLLSGPAAGVVGAAFVAEASGFEQTITIDIGGTSTDVALMNNRTMTETTNGKIGGHPTKLPMIDIHTVGAGGGSIAWFDAGGALRVGPVSAGANPGPAAYALGGTEATVTDANVVLGRLIPAAFLGGSMQLDSSRAYEAVGRVAERLGTTAEEAALGIIRVVNANMEAAIRVISVERGSDPRDFALVAFGGAGPLHACELASALRIPRVLVPTVPGVLSALGMLVADTLRDYVRTVMLPAEQAQGTVVEVLEQLGQQGRSDLLREGIAAEKIQIERYLDLRYAGQSYELLIPFERSVAQAVSDFHKAHERRFGYNDPNERVQVVNVRLKARGLADAPILERRQTLAGASATPLYRRTVYFAGPDGVVPYEAPIYDRSTLAPGVVLSGPAVIIQYDTTTVLPPGWQALVDSVGNLILEFADEEVSPEKSRATNTTTAVSPISLEIFRSALTAIAEEMGTVLMLSSYSPNIKERRDFSCALFDAQGRLVAQAAHIPVHLGAMPDSVAAALVTFDHFAPGDIIALNDPFLGGSHLPDITLIAPIFIEIDGEQRLIGFAANRAHHSDVGGMSPGSMPLATEIYQEGVIIPPVKLWEAGQLNQPLLSLILRNIRTPDERRGDLAAQVAANRTAARRMQELVERWGLSMLDLHTDALIDYAQRITQATIAAIPDGTYQFTDSLDDDGVSDDPVSITATVTVRGCSLSVDFSGSSPQTRGNINAVAAVAKSATYYVVRCLMPPDAPMNHGTFAPVTVIAPGGTVVNARPPAGVAQGNVETSQRITDVIFGALASALPDGIPAASQGTMNNITAGGIDPRTQQPFAYYETMGGGMGAGPGLDGLSGVHVHMSNTLNTPVEAFEYAYPMRITKYQLRDGSGGAGSARGGDGLVRAITFSIPTDVTLLTERRRLAPYGLQGGGPGMSGENRLLHDGEETLLPGKAHFRAMPGDCLTICSPGGGGWGKPEE